MTMTPDQYCQDRAARSGSSFYYSFLFLPPERRRAITALYAFCREVDDVVDEVSEPQVAAAKLQWWREEVGRLFAGQPQHPVTRALVPHVAQLNLPAEYFEEVIDGMEMDLEQGSYRTFSELRLYCHRAAGVVGLMSAEVFGYQDRRTLDYAARLGLGFQLINILRDVREDARRGRIYLPQDELQRFGMGPTDLLQVATPERVQALFQFQAERARRTCEEALALLPEVDRRAQLPGLIMARIYLTLLDEIEAEGYRVLEQRTRLTPLRKLWLAWTTARRERRRARRSGA